MPALRSKVIENSSDDVGIVDAGNDLDCATAEFADLDINAEYSLEAARPCHGLMLFGSGHRLVFSAPLATPRWGDPCTPTGIRCKDAVEPREIHPWSWNQSGESSDEIQRLEHYVRGAISPGCLE